MCIHGSWIVTGKEMIKVSIEEFSRLQSYMLATEKDLDGYRLKKIKKAIIIGGQKQTIEGCPPKSVKKCGLI